MSDATQNASAEDASTTEAVSTDASAKGAFAVVTTFKTESQAQQDDLIGGLTEEVERWISRQPGFAGSAFYRSEDGERMIGQMQWHSRGD